VLRSDTTDACHSQGAQGTDREHLQAGSCHRQSESRSGVERILKEHHVRLYAATEVDRLVEEIKRTAKTSPARSLHKARSGPAASNCGDAGHGVQPAWGLQTDRVLGLDPQHSRFFRRKPK